MSVPSHGVNSKGEIVQTTQVTGLFTPAVDSEGVSIALREVNGKQIRALVGVAQLVKVNLQLVNQSDGSSNLVAKKPVVKKAVVKKPVVKKPTVEKAVVKKPVAKKPTVEKPVVKKPVVKKPAPKK
jgi:hypothetical protein